MSLRSSLMEERNKAIVTEQESERIYFAERFNEAFDYQSKLLHYGKVHISIATIVLAFIQPLFAIIGFIGFWSSYYTQGNQLKEIEEEFIAFKKEYEVSKDITDFQLLLFKYGSILAFVFSIVYVIGWLL